MAKKIVTLYIDDASIRLLVTRGKRIKQWADSPLEAGLIRNAVVLKEEEVANRIKQLFKAVKVSAKKVVIGVSGLHCLTRPIILPQLPYEMLDEAVRREAKRLLPVPLEHVYISWQTIPAPPGKTQVFLVAVPCKAADALFKMLHKLDLKPYLMDLKPLAITRMVKEPTAIIVDVQPTDFDIVIMADGIAQPIRTVPLPSEAYSWQEKLPTIKKDLARTIEFYNSNNPERPLVSTIPIFASGELAHEPELCQSLSQELGHPVLPLPSPLECPGGLSPSRYMANLGLILKELAPKEASPLVTNLNVLPAPYQPKTVSLTNVLAVPAAVIAVGLLIFAILLIQNASADVASIRGQLTTTDQLLRQKLAQRQELTENIAELKEKIAEAEVTGNNFIAAMGNIEKQSSQFSGNLEVTVSSLPDTINLTKIQYASNILTLKGSAPSEKEVLSYLRELDASGRFAEINITSMKKIEGKGMDFTLVLKGGA